MSVALESGLPIVVEYFFSGGMGVMRLEWTRPDGVRETIPPTAFRTSLQGVVGLDAAYFHGVALADPWFARLESQVNQDFGWTGPRREAAQPLAGDTLDITLPAGRWTVSWIVPATGEAFPPAVLSHRGGVARLAPPAWATDLALDLRRAGTP